MTRSLVPLRGSLVDDRRVVLGIPNTGRLREEVVALLANMIEMSASDRTLLYHSDDLTVACARSNDLPRLLADGMIDLAVTGHDYVVESGAALEEVRDLGFQAGLICLLGSEALRDWRHRDAVVVATQYPGITRAYFAERGRPAAEVYAISGAAELYARTGAVDLIVDAYMTGGTASANGLEVLDRVLETSGRLFVRPGWRTEPKDIGAVLATILR
jgi:ATP phosphoribosyltransferase